MSQVQIDLVDAHRRPVVAELDIRLDTVEIRCHDLHQSRLVAIEDRDRLRAWLAAPDGVLVCDDSSWGSATHGGIWLHIPDLVPSCWLSQQDVDTLRAQL